MVSQSKCIEESLMQDKESEFFKKNIDDNTYQYFIYDGQEYGYFS